MMRLVPEPLVEPLTLDQFNCYLTAWVESRDSRTVYSRTRQAPQERCDSPYVQHRLKAAGYENHSQGNPRLLNQLARVCLMASATERKDLVDGSCLLQAVAEVRAIGANPGPDNKAQEV